ncbi:MAG: NAD(P)/FAD-dependent oxidoreductase [Dissulfuribacterales bacterium]
MNKKHGYLFQDGTIGTMSLKNRIIFNPCETAYATVDGEVTQRIIDFYVRRAEGGAGLLVVYSTQACTKIDPYDPFAHSLRIDDNAYLPMLSELTEAVHRAGAKIAILVTAGAGAYSMGFPYDRGMEGMQEMQNVGASDKQSLIAQRPVRQLRTAEVKQLIEVYGLSARRVKMAGFDALYIHALNYLIAQFISPLYNTRDDEFGKGFEGRAHFITELIESCRRNVGADFPIVVRIGVDEYFPGGRGVEESIRLIKRMEAAGVNAIDVTAGIYESMQMIIPPIYLPKGVHVDLAAAVKSAVSIPVIAQGRLYDADLCENVIREGKADFVGIVRGLLADPQWVNKVEQGNEDEVRKCISCNQCFDRITKFKTIRCAVNPTVGREGEFAEVPSRASRPKRVMIVGAGPGGMEAARVAAERGHTVKLYEKTGELGGGQFKMASSAPFKDEFNNLIRFYETQFDRFDKLQVVLNTKITAEEIKREEPDVVVLATGAKALVPEIEGMDRPNVITNHDLLAGDKKIRGKVVIAGGGCAGSGTADKLSEEGVDVTVVEMLEECDLDEELITRLSLMNRFQQKDNIDLKTSFTVKKITDEGVVVMGPNDEMVTLEADYVVLAFGSVSHNPLEKDIRTICDEVYVIGDAGRVGRIKDAVADGFFVGYKI